MKLHELNGEALEYMEARPFTFRRLSEEQFVSVLHDLRGVTMPQGVLERLRENATINLPRKSPTPSVRFPE